MHRTHKTLLRLIYFCSPLGYTTSNIELGQTLRRRGSLGSGDLITQVMFVSVHGSVRFIRRVLCVVGCLCFCLCRCTCHGALSARGSPTYSVVARWDTATVTVTVTGKRGLRCTHSFYRAVTVTVTVTVGRGTASQHHTMIWIHFKLSLSYVCPTVSLQLLLYYDQSCLDSESSTGSLRAAPCAGHFTDARSQQEGRRTLG